MTLATLTVLPNDMPALANNPNQPPNVVPTAFDKTIAATKPDHWYAADSFINGQWIDKGVGDRTLVNSTATAPSVATIAGQSYLNFANASGMNPTDGGVLLESMAAWTLMFVRHPNGGSDNDPLLAEAPGQVASGTNKLLAIDAYIQDANTTDLIVVSVTGSSGSNIFNTGAIRPARNVPHLFMLSYSPAVGMRLRIDNALYNVLVASPAQLPTQGRIQIGRRGTSTGVASFMTGGISDVLSWSRDITANSADDAALRAALIAKYGILT